MPVNSLVRISTMAQTMAGRNSPLRHNSCRVRPLGHDPHHAKAACCRKLLVMNPNLPDGLSRFRMIARLTLWDSIGASRDPLDVFPVRLAPASPPGLSFYALCIGGHRTGGKPLRLWPRGSGPLLWPE